MNWELLLIEFFVVLIDLYFILYVIKLNTFSFLKEGDFEIFEKLGFRG